MHLFGLCPRHTPEVLATCNWLARPFSYYMCIAENTMERWHLKKHIQARTLRHYSFLTNKKWWYCPTPCLSTVTNAPGSQGMTPAKSLRFGDARAVSKLLRYNINPNQCQLGHCEPFVAIREEFPDVSNY